MEVLFGMLHDLGGAVRLPNDYDNHFLFFRSTFQQQYWLQENLLIPELARQGILFRSLPPGHGFRAAFQQASGIELNAFLELSFAMVCQFVNGSHSVEERFFTNLTHAYPPGTIQAFLATLSKDLNALRSALASLSTERSVLYEFIEKSPLQHFPLLRQGSRYYCYCGHLLYRTLQNFVYDTLRSADSSAFTTKFGSVFERYIEMCLSYASITFIPERELIKLLPRGSKVVDFAVLASDSVVLIDAKAIELPVLGMIAHKAEIVADRAKSAIIKAISQGFEVAANLQDVTVFGKPSSLYLLVVTFKDLFLGTGREFYENVDPRRIDKLLVTYDDMPPIPLENIWFISINDLDLLVEHLKSTGTSLADFLKRVSVEGSGNFVFRQYIPGPLSKPSFPHYLDEEFDNLAQRLRVLLATQP